MSKKGRYYEYQVMKIFESYGYATIRTLGSGGGTKKSKPDVIASNSRNMYSMEVKHRTDDVLYISDEQVEELKDFSYIFGALPLIVAKFGRNPFYVFNPDEIDHCKKNYRIRYDDLYKGVELKKFIQNN